MNFQTLLDMFAARRKSFTFLGFLALLALGIQLYLSGYQRPQLEQVQTEWFAKRGAMARGETEADATRYQRGVRDLDEFKKRFIPKKDFARVLSRLYDTAKSNSLALQGITYKPGKKNKATQIMTYDVSFTVAGKYSAVKSFLADLVRYPDMVTVDSISLSNQSMTQESVNLKIQTTVYLLTEGA
ncbi:type 4a pilus biogenesis protein PilO [Geomonas sp. Red69]|uniref:type 4a pilus biogenesis protein PilO n=1 Tax=Geomonas diazotrophica TaxID=2843197 RepID=UPI001C128E9C|nr:MULTISPECIES: type 4a pilus biogenesis protein PilO [Geomonas]MBU5637738.1 type 4a pilus biogenesis protein PilO [Geomonas diazotrophica]QXE85340.1 type 4a pilus biogenesis protein PilO [Geomonas nitrogeniifigens]